MMRERYVEKKRVKASFNHPLTALVAVTPAPFADPETEYKPSRSICENVVSGTLFTSFPENAVATVR